MDAKGTKRKLTAILSADVMGYSRLMQNDEKATVRSITSYREVITNLIQKYQGRVVDAKGDNILAEFSSVVDAVQCGVEIQKDLKLKNDEMAEDRRMEFRIGINLGDVIEEGDTIYGDGVNIAARIEGLAEGGGICISGTAYDQIGKKLPLGYVYLGEQKVKNIEKPVRVYSVLMEPEAVGKVIGEKRTASRQWKIAVGALAVILIAAITWYFFLRKELSKIETASIENMAYELPENPSIAVLPFQNMSGDQEQEYMADGFTENIITALSKTPKMFVIASNSVFTYKGKPVKVQHVAEEMGVRYVLEGSLQKSGDRLRVHAQLIDAIGGHHLWADRYDRELKDIFVLQDEITMKIINAVQVELTEGEKSRVFAKETENLQAYIKFFQAKELFLTQTKEGNARSRALFEEVIAIDPNFSSAYAILGTTYFMDISYGTSKSPKQSVRTAAKMVRKAITLDESNPIAYVNSGILFLKAAHQYEKAIARFERAISLDPNSSFNYIHLSDAFSLSGRHEEALQFAERALRRNPKPPSFAYRIMGHAYIFNGRYEDAIATFKKAVKVAPRDYFARICLIVAYVLVGREDEAKVEAEEVLKIKPTYCISGKERYKNPADRELLRDAERKAGFPDCPPRQDTK